MNNRKRIKLKLSVKRMEEVDNRRIFGNVLLIIGGFIFTETIVRNMIDVLGSMVSFWVLGAYSILLIMTAASLLKGKIPEINELFQVSYLGLTLVALGLVKMKIIPIWVLALVIYSLPVIAILLWIIKKKQYKDKEKLKLDNGKEKTKNIKSINLSKKDLFTLANLIMTFAGFLIIASGIFYAAATEMASNNNLIAIENAKSLLEHNKTLQFDSTLNEHVILNNKIGIDQMTMSLICFYGAFLLGLVAVAIWLVGTGITNKNEK